MFLKSRYDILLGKSGREFVETSKSSIPLDEEHLIIYGPRGSGKTQALVEDMLSYARLGNNVCFFSDNQALSNDVKWRIPPKRCPIYFFTYRDSRALEIVKNLDCDVFYLDDFDDVSWRKDFFNAIKSLLCHKVRIVIASIAKEMPFDTTGWTFRELTRAGYSGIQGL